MRCGTCGEKKPSVGYSPLYGFVCRECFKKLKRRDSSAFFGRHGDGIGRRPFEDLRHDNKGVAIFFVYAIILLMLCGMVWYVGNEVIFGEHGIGTYYENSVPENQKPTHNVYKWVWNVWPIVVIIGAVVYTIMAGQIREPRTYGY